MAKKTKQPVLRPTSFTQEEVERMARASEAAAKESSGSPVEAFMSPRVEFCGHRLYEPTLDTVIALEAIQSPFLSGEGTLLLRDIAEAMLILTTDPEDLQDLVADRDVFRRAGHAFARTIPLRDMGQLNGMIQKVLSSAFSTVIAGESGGGGGKKKTPSAGS